MRKIPIVTFINKMDRDGHEPIDLMDEIERVLGIPCSPINWPIGMGKRFQGVFDRQKRELMRFVESSYGAKKAESEIVRLDDPSFIDTVGEAAHKQLLAELELLDVAGNPFDLDRFRAFGRVDDVLDFIARFGCLDDGQPVFTGQVS